MQNKGKLTGEFNRFGVRDGMKVAALVAAGAAAAMVVPALAVPVTILAGKIVDSTRPKKPTL